MFIGKAKTYFNTRGYVDEDQIEFSTVSFTPMTETIVRLPWLRKVMT